MARATAHDVSADRPFPFLRLPTELRNDIYRRVGYSKTHRYAFSSDSFTVDIDHATSLPLLLTSKEISKGYLAEALRHIHLTLTMVPNPNWTDDAVERLWSAFKVEQVFQVAKIVTFILPRNQGYEDRFSKTHSFLMRLMTHMGQLKSFKVLVHVEGERVDQTLRNWDEYPGFEDPGFLPTPPQDVFNYRLCQRGIGYCVEQKQFGQIAGHVVIKVGAFAFLAREKAHEKNKEGTCWVEKEVNKYLPVGHGGGDELRKWKEDRY